MKIKEVKTYIVSQKLGNKSFCYSQAWYNTRTIMIVEIITDDNISGFGEAFGNAYINKAIIENVYKDKIIGQSIFDTSKIWEQLYNCLRDNGQKGSCIQAISAIDIALWDLKGKYTHLPVYALMGGARREKIKLYATGLYHSNSQTVMNDLIKEAVSYVNDGFKAIKIKIGFGIEDDIKTVKAIRKAVGNDIELMVDANHAYNSMTAIRLSREIEECNILWFEEPVPPEDLNGYIEIKQKTNIPVAGGEAEFTAYGHRNIVNKRAVDILQPDCCVTGGLTEFLKISTLAKLENIQCYPHIWGSAIAVRTGYNACFVNPDYPDSLNPSEVYMELDRTENIFREELSMVKLKIKSGYVYKENYEGLGIVINRELISKYQIG